MALPQPDPSNPALPAPLFADVDAVRGDHMRANNQLIWEDLQYLQDGYNIADATAKTTPVDADVVPLADSAAANIIKKLTFANLWAFILAKIVSTGAGTPVGTYIQHAGATAPTGFLACDAAAVSRSTYADLFAVIGTTYGVGNGTTTFNLPDARGLVMVGAGAHGTMTRANGTAFNGGTLGASRNDQMQGFISNSGVMVNGAGSNGAVYGLTTEDAPGTSNGYEAVIAASSAGNQAKSSGPKTDSTNGTPRTGNETRPAEIAVLVCIKY